MQISLRNRNMLYSGIHQDCNYMKEERSIPSNKHKDNINTSIKRKYSEGISDYRIHNILNDKHNKRITLSKRKRKNDNYFHCLCTLKSCCPEGGKEAHNNFDIWPASMYTPMNPHQLLDAVGNDTIVEDKENMARNMWLSNSYQVSPKLVLTATSTPSALQLTLRSTQNYVDAGCSTNMDLTEWKNITKQDCHQSTPNSYICHPQQKSKTVYAYSQESGLYYGNLDCSFPNVHDHINSKLSNMCDKSEIKCETTCVSFIPFTMKKHDPAIKNIQRENEYCVDESFYNKTLNGTKLSCCLKNDLVNNKGHTCLFKANKESDSRMVSCEKVLNETFSVNSTSTNCKSLPRYRNKRNIASGSTKRTTSIEKKTIRGRKGTLIKGKQPHQQIAITNRRRNEILDMPISKVLHSSVGNTLLAFSVLAFAAFAAGSPSYGFSGK